jgi:ATP-dependent protease ClpP protease subunit
MSGRAYPLMCRIRAEGGVARMDIMDDIGADPWLGGGISAAEVCGKLAAVRGPLDVHISSQGGVVGDGLAIFNALVQHPGDVTTFIDGYALSVASVIAQAGKRRVASPVSAVMIHDPWGFAEGNQADMQRMAAALGTNGDVIARAYADRAGGTVEQWRALMQAETWYDADEALAAGLVDVVSGGSRLPAGLDLDALAARAPVRIMARLRAAAPDSGDGGGDDLPPCKTCKGRGRLPHPGTGKPGKKCPECDGAGTYDPDAGGDDDEDEPDGNEGQGGNDGMDRLRGAAGRPYEPQPYRRTPDENVQCPACQKFGDDDSRYCGQCGTQLTGRTDVHEAPLAPAAGASRLAAMSFGELRDAMRPVVHEWLVAAGLLPGADGFFRPVNAAGVDHSDWDGDKAMAGGVGADDPAAFYEGICAGKKDGNPRSQDSWALPYRYKPGGPPNAAGVKNALDRLPQAEGLTNEAEARKTLQAAMKKVNPDWEPGDSASTTITAADAVARFRAAVPALRKERA